jgi:hypothetical protein
MESAAALKLAAGIVAVVYCNVAQWKQYDPASCDLVPARAYPYNPIVPEDAGRTQQTTLIDDCLPRGARVYVCGSYIIMKTAAMKLGTSV